MERRKFIQNVGLSLVYVSLPSYLISCSGNDQQLALSDLLEKSSTVLSSHSNFLKEGNDDFCYYILDAKSFVFENYPGHLAFIYCQKSKIVGFTILIKGNDTIDKMVKELSALHKGYQLNFDNEFGKEYHWSDSQKTIKLSYNDHKELPKLTFYTEILSDYDLVI